MAAEIWKTTPFAALILLAPLLGGAGPLEKQVRRYLLTRRTGGVEMLGRVSDAEKDRLYATADIFVAPATGRESFGIVLLEAMAAGKAIVAGYEFSLVLLMASVSVLLLGSGPLALDRSRR